MIFIDLENNPPDQAWITKADAITQELINELDSDKRNSIIDRNEKLWGELKDYLADLSFKKCWYTESVNAGAHCHVDHFRPKKEAIDEKKIDQGGYWWLAFEWLNYRYSGPAANVRKKSYFHVNANKANTYGDSVEAEDILFLDPTEINDPDYLAFDNEGRVIPKSVDKTSRAYLRAEYSIRRLNLNFESLKEARRDLFRIASIKINRVDKLLSLQAKHFDQTRENTIKANMKELWKMACRNAVYSAAIKFCLKSSGKEWALEIVAKAA